MADRPFARVYYVDLERDYPDIYRDNDALSTYVRLLAVADAMWPAVPEVPRSSKGAIVKQLMQAGLLIAVPPYCYRIKGLDAERTARSESARYAASIKYGTAPRIPNGTADRSAERTADGNAISSPVQTRPAEPTPIRAQSAPKMTGTIVDERDLPEEEKQRRYIERMAKRTGVDAS